MLIDFAKISASERYFAMVQTIIPRPIAWVLSDNGSSFSEAARYNLAPFSFFTGVCSDPPLLMLSVGNKTAGDEAGRIKDTCVNIQERKNFIVHIANVEAIDSVNRSAATLNHGDSEVSALNLPLTPFDGAPLPRLNGMPIAMFCSLYRLDSIGNAPQNIIYGNIHQLYLDDTVIVPDESGCLVIDSQKINPLARLGGRWYSQLGAKLEADRPQ